MTAKYSRTKHIVFSIVLAIVFFLSIEILARIYFTVKYHDINYIIYGFGRQRGYTHEKEFKLKKTHVYKNIVHIKIANPDGGYIKAVPGTYTETYDFKIFRVNINSHGFRGKEFSRIKPEGVYRIFCLGGSSTECLEVEDGKDYPSVLEKKLNSLGLPVKAEVVNAGYLASRSEQYTSLFLNDVLQYRPDMVTVYEGYNEYHMFFEQAAVLPGAIRIKIIEYLYNPIFSKSLFLSILWEKKHTYTKKMCDKETVEKIISGYEQNITKIVEVASKNNVKIVLVKQAVYFKNYGTKIGENFNIISEKITSGIPVHIDEWYYYMRIRLVDSLKKIAEMYSVLFIDMDDIISEYPPRDLFYDQVHLTEKGNEVVAQVLASVISEII